MSEPSPDPPPLAASHPVARSIGSLRHELDRLEGMITPEVRVAERAGRRIDPAWQRAHPGEARLPVAAVVLGAIALQLGLPDQLTIRPDWVLPALEAAVLVAITAANPRRIDRASTWLRRGSIGLIAWHPSPTAGPPSS